MIRTLTIIFLFTCSCLTVFSQSETLEYIYNAKWQATMKIKKGKAQIDTTYFRYRTPKDELTDQVKITIYGDTQYVVIEELTNDKYSKIEFNYYTIRNQEDNGEIHRQYVGNKEYLRFDKYGVRYQKQGSKGFEARYYYNQTEDYTIKL